ncbi:MAG: hypothetical protein AAF399_21955 [Bacteroidota bacterium]
MRIISVLILTLFSTALLFGQESRTLISNIEKGDGSKSKVLSAMEAQILAITKKDFPDWTILSVSVHPTSGALTIVGTDHNGKRFSYSGEKLKNMLSTSNSHYQPPKTANATTEYGTWECLRRSLAGMGCDPWINATDMSIPTSKLDPVEQECRRRYLLMLHG